MARRKSYNDIREQARRLRAETGARGQSERYRRVSEAGRRYLGNIRRSRSYRKSLGAFNRLNDEVIREMNGRGNRTRAIRLDNQAVAVANRMQNRQYSQRTYMGLNAP